MGVVSIGTRGNADTSVARTFPALLGYGAATATALAAFEYTGGTLYGYKKDTEGDEFERRQKLRKSFRSPAEQTLSELGEGRGTFGPFALDKTTSTAD